MTRVNIAILKAQLMKYIRSVRQREELNAPQGLALGRAAQTIGFKVLGLN